MCSVSSSAESLTALSWLCILCRLCYNTPESVTQDEFKRLVRFSIYYFMWAYWFLEIPSVICPLWQWATVGCFPFSALTLLVGWQEGHPACNKLGVGLFLVMIWLELCSRIQNADILVPANRDAPGKWPMKRRESLGRQLWTTGWEGALLPSSQRNQKPFMVKHPRAGSGVVRIDLLHFLAGCRKRQLNQA